MSNLGKSLWKNHLLMELKWMQWEVYCNHRMSRAVLMKLLRDRKIWHASIPESPVSFSQASLGLSVIRTRQTFYVVYELKLYFRKRKAEIDYKKAVFSFWWNIKKLNFDCFALQRAECLDSLWLRREKEPPKQYKNISNFVDVSPWTSEIWGSLVVAMKITVFSYVTPRIYLSL